MPVVAAGLGPVAGLGAARLCAAHLSILVEGTAQLFVAGPPVVRSGIGEDVDKEQLGGSRVHGRNAAVDLVAASEPEAFGMIRRFLSYLPPSAYQLPPVIAGATIRPGGGTSGCCPPYRGTGASPTGSGTSCARCSTPAR